MRCIRRRRAKRREEMWALTRKVSSARGGSSARSNLCLFRRMKITDEMDQIRALVPPRLLK